MIIGCPSAKLRTSATNSPDRTFQSRVLSLPAEARYFPSGENETQSEGPSCPTSARINRPVRSQTRTVPSKEEVASRVLSWFHATVSTSPRWATVSIVHERTPRSGGGLVTRANELNHSPPGFSAIGSGLMLRGTARGRVRLVCCGICQN